MKTNEDIFKEIETNKEITKKQIDLLKNRSNRLQKDQINSFFFEEIEKKLNSYGLPVKKEDGEKLLKWLKQAKFKKLYGYREFTILENAKPEDIFFNGFYDAGYFYHSYRPYFNVGEMQIVILSEPSIVG